MMFVNIIENSFLNSKDSLAPFSSVLVQPDYFLDNFDFNISNFSTPYSIDSFTNFLLFIGGGINNFAVLPSTDITIGIHAVTIGAIISSILVITSKNPVISVLYLIVLFLNVAVYLILLGIHFIGFAYLIVYVGAIAILFIFVIMLMNIKVSELVYGNTFNSFPLGLILGVSFLYPLYNVIMKFIGFYPFNDLIDSKINQDSITYKTNIDIHNINKNLYTMSTDPYSFNTQFKDSNNLVEKTVNTIQNQNIDLENYKSLINLDFSNNYPIFSSIWANIKEGENNVISATSSSNVEEVTCYSDNISDIVFLSWDTFITPISSISTQSQILFADYAILLIIVAILLLIAIIGAILLSSQSSQESREP